MPRPALTPGTHGKITVTEDPTAPESSRYRYTARYRLIDKSEGADDHRVWRAGARIDLSASGSKSSTTAAKHAIELAASRRQLLEDERVQTVAVVAVEAAEADRDAQRVSALAYSLTEQAHRDGTLSTSSLRSYKSQLSRLAESSLGQAHVSEVDAAMVDGYLKLIAETVGTASAKLSRACLARVFQHAVIRRLVATNPVRDTSVIRTPRFDPEAVIDGIDHTRSLTKAERLDLALKVSRDARAVDLDLRDFLLAGLAIGSRIGELAAIRWADVKITHAGSKLSAAVTINATSTRVDGVGMVRSATKTKTSRRTIPVPRRVAALLLRRARAAGVDLATISSDTRPVFPAPGRWEAPQERTKLRDLSNTSKRLREAFDRAGYEWLSFHGLRRSAITQLADKMPIRQVADFAGHASTRTTIDSYISRGAVSEDVALYL